MKKFREEDFSEEHEDFNREENINIINEKEGIPDEEVSYKRLEEEKKKDDLITPVMKNFRKLIGSLLLVFIGYFIIFLNNSGTTNYKLNLQSGKIDGVKAGDKLSKGTVKLEAKDISIDLANSYGKIELSIWNFADKEDGDYVQVFVNGSPQTEPFAITHKAMKIGVPDKAVIQVRGIRDGSNNGITYGVFFNKTGETYLNTVPLNAANTYTLKTAQ